MATVKWIRLNIDMFDDEKIKLVEAMPEADSILIIWIKLLCLAGKVNDAGIIYLSNEIPYTDEMLATVFRRPLNTARLALKVLEQMHMVSVEESRIEIVNWEKHQNVDGMERIREQTRARVAKCRERQKIEGNDGSATSNDGSALDKTRLDKTREDKESPSFKKIIEYLNKKIGSSFKHTSKDTKSHINARWEEGYRLEDFQKVIDIKTEQWADDSKMSGYLRPKTLFSPKFESYLMEWRKQYMPDPSPEKICPKCGEPYLANFCECGWSE